MNRNILTFLNEYAEIPDPQYAIMLRGAWGCGKTFFIRQWMEQLKNNRDADKLKWQPIYVSLYGLTTTQQITEQINKEISPWLYSKGMNPYSEHGSSGSNAPVPVEPPPRYHHNGK